MIYSIILAALSVGQGEAVLVRIPAEPDLAAVEIDWNGDRRPLAPLTGEDGEVAQWQALIGIDLDEPAGDRTVTVLKSYAAGPTVNTALELTIEPRAFPESRLTVAQRYVEPDPADQARAGREAAEIAGLYDTVTPTQWWSGPFAIPVTGETGGRNFGHRRVFNGQPRSPHSGADLRAAEGTPVYVANNGRVVLAKPLFFSGNAVFVDHGMGVYSVYLHLSEFRVAVGDRVAKGDLIGLAGATGRVTGPHLHWGVRIHGARVDPFSLVETAWR